MNPSRLLFRRRPEGTFRAADENLLERVGEELVTRIVVVRKPIRTFVRRLANAIAMGRMRRFLATHTDYDQLFHLSIWINDQYCLEKEHVIRFYEVDAAPDATGEYFVVPVPEPHRSISEWIERTWLFMGDRFSRYEAFTNNCQDFIVGVLQANSVDTPEAVAFTRQDTRAILRAMPFWVQTVFYAITNAAEHVDYTLYGAHGADRVVPPEILERFLADLDASDPDQE